jgi:hypothetical protein
MQSQRVPHTEIPPMPQHSFSHSIKFLRPDLLGEPERQVFRKYFSGFTRDPDPDFLWVYEQLRADGQKGQPPYNLRRFSGGSELPRGRYSTICDGDGHSFQTLAMELLAYSDRQIGDLVEVFDLNDPPLEGLRDSLPQELRKTANSFRWQALLVRSKPLVVEGEKAPQQFVIPYQIAKLGRNRVFDLRRRETLDWLIKALNEDFPNTVFWLQSNTDHPMPLFHAARGTSADTTRRGMVAEGKFSLGLKGVGAEISGVFDLIPYLVDSRLGGTPMTELISACAIEQGCDGLVYPSARADCGIAYQGDGPHATFWGWNIVDLLQAPHLQMQECISICVNPAEYASAVYGLLEITQPKGTEKQTQDPMAIAGWAAHGFGQTTVEFSRREVWRMRLARNPNPNYGFDKIVVTRTPRLGLMASASRKPNEYASIGELLLGLATGEITMQSAITPYSSAAAPTVGELLARFGTHYPVWGYAARTIYPGWWFLLQESQYGSISLLCPLCYSTSDAHRADDASLLGCRYCGLSVAWPERSPSEALRLARTAVGDGLREFAS